MLSLLKRVAIDTQALDAARSASSRGELPRATAATLSFDDGVEHALRSIESLQGRARALASLTMKLARGSSAGDQRRLRAAVDAACAIDREARLPRGVIADCIAGADSSAASGGAAACAAWTLHCAGILPLERVLGALRRVGGGCDSDAADEPSAKRARRDGIVVFAEQLRALSARGESDRVFSGIVLHAHALARGVRCESETAARIVSAVCCCTAASPADDIVSTTSALRAVRVGADAGASAEVHRLYARQLGALLRVAESRPISSGGGATAPRGTQSSAALRDLIDELAARLGADELPRLVRDHIVCAAEALARPPSGSASAATGACEALPPTPQREEERLADAAQQCVNADVAALALRRAHYIAAAAASSDRHDTHAHAAAAATAICDSLFDDAAAGLAAGTRAAAPAVGTAVLFSDDAPLRTRPFFLIVLHQAFALARRCCGADPAATVDANAAAGAAPARAVVAYERWLSARLASVALTRSLVDGVVQVLTARVPYAPTDVLRAQLRVFKPLLSRTQLHAAAESSRAFSVRSYIQLLRVGLAEHASPRGGDIASRGGGRGNKGSGGHSAAASAAETAARDAANAFVAAFARDGKVSTAVREAAMWRPKWWHGACLRAILAPIEEAPAVPSDNLPLRSPRKAGAPPAGAPALPSEGGLSAAERDARVRFADELARQGLIKGSRYAIHKGKRRRAEELAAAASRARLSGAGRGAAPAAEAEALALSWSAHLDALPHALMDDVRAERSRGDGAARSAVPIVWALRMKPVAAALRDALRESADAAGAPGDAAATAAAATTIGHVAEYFVATVFKVSVAVPERVCAARVWTKPLLSAAHAAGGAALVTRMLRCATHFIAGCKHGTTPARYRRALAATLGNAIALWGPAGSARVRDGTLWSECGALLGAAAAMPTSALVVHFAAALCRSLSSQHSVRDATLRQLPVASLRRIRWAVERAHWSAASRSGAPAFGGEFS